MVAVRGKNIDLESLSLTFAQDIADNANDEKVHKFVPLLPFPYKLKDAVSFIERSIAEMKIKQSLLFGIRVKKEKKVVGVIGFKSFDHDNCNAEVGYWIGSEHHWKGIGSESLHLLVEYGFKKLKLNRIYATVAVDNLASL